jgi:MAF protein
VFEGEYLSQEDRKALKAKYPTLVLASASPNRRMLLEYCGIKPIVRPQDVLEFTNEKEPGRVVKSLAEAKLASLMTKPDFDSTLPALSSDTLVLTDGVLTGKPKDRFEAFNILRSFSGKSQLILSGYALYDEKTHNVKSGFEGTAIRFRVFSDEEIEAYLDTEEWRGAAGGYKIQMHGYDLIETVEGSFSNAIGLPLERLISL